jgi:hypothetical protein
LDEAQNYRIWNSENPHAFVETRLHPIKVGVWIATSRRRLIAFIVKIKEPVINEVKVHSKIKKKHHLLL